MRGNKYLKCTISALLTILLTACSSTEVRNNEAPVPAVVAPTQVENTTETDNSVEVAFDGIPGCVPYGSANRSVSLLLIGNSLMNDVQKKLKTLLDCAGYDSDMATSNPGGSFLRQHIDNEDTSTLIARGYDLTLLQAQSGNINEHQEPYFTINTLKNRIEAAGSTMGFYQTWAFQLRDPSKTEAILSGYERVAGDFDAPMIAIGHAWDYFYTSNNESPPFSLFTDYAHATQYGKSLIAFVLYAYLTGETPVDLWSLGLDDDEARLLQVVAWDTYQAYPAVLPRNF